MRAFVTGATGFVGSHLVERLLAAGHEVAALVRSPAKAERIFTDRVPHYVRGDLDDAAALRQGAEGADAVFHLAALTAARSADEFHRVNVAATERLAGCSTGHFVFVSSLAAAGPSAPGRPLVGDEPARPVTPYGRSKSAAETLVQRHEGAWTIVRPPVVYGPRDVELLRMFKLVRRGIAPVFGTGTQELSFIYVDDLADALIAAADLPTGGTWFVTHPETATQRELVRLAGHAVGGKAPVVLPIPGFLARGILAITGSAAALAGQTTLLSLDKANEFLAPALTADPSRFVNATGWTARVGLVEGLERTVAWYRTHGWL